MLARTLQVLLAPLAFTAAHAATITLYDIRPTTIPYSMVPDATVTYSPVGTGTDGATTYIGHGVATGFLSPVFVSDKPTPSVVTASIEPLTYEITLVEDASHLSRAAGPTGVFNAGSHLSCTYDAKGEGICVEELHLASTVSQIPSGFGTWTQTYTGTPVPIYTLTTNDGARHLPAGGSSILGMTVVVFGLAVGAFGVLL